MRKLAPVTACITFVLVTFMLTVTATPAGSATIYQCAQKNNGQLRVVSAPTECRPSETSITLNIPVVVHGSVIGGNASTNGAIGFTYDRIQAGQYVVNFDTALDSAPDCVVSIIDPPINEVAYCTQNNTVLSPSALGVSCHFLNATTGVVGLRDSDFSFACTL